MSQLGLLLLDNGEQAGMAWLRKAADLGDPKALLALSDVKGAVMAGEPAAIYLTGQTAYLDGDFPTAAAAFQAAAEKGHEKARKALGLMYLFGQGVEADPIKAGGWYSLTTFNGDWALVQTTGRYYRDPTPAQLRQIEGIALLHKAEDDDVLNTEFRPSYPWHNTQRAVPLLVRLYGDGRHVSQNVQWRRKYERLNRDFVAEHAICAKARSSEKCVDALIMADRGWAAMDEILTLNVAKSKEVEWYKRLHDAGYGAASGRYADALLSGAGVERDPVAGYVLKLTVALEQVYEFYPQTNADITPGEHWRVRQILIERADLSFMHP